MMAWRRIIQTLRFKVRAAKLGSGALQAALTTQVSQQRK